jgi:hypothetical protein
LYRKEEESAFFHSGLDPTRQPRSPFQSSQPPDPNPLSFALSISLCQDAAIVRTGGAMIGGQGSTMGMTMGGSTIIGMTTITMTTTTPDRVGTG